MDLWHKITQWIDYNRYTFLALLVVAVGIVPLAMTGCESTTLFGDDTVTRSELQQAVIDTNTDLAVQKTQLDAALAAYNEQVVKFNAQVEAAQADLDKQDQMKAEFLAQVQAVALETAGGTFNPLSTIPLAFGLAGIAIAGGLKLDNRKKDNVIKAQKTTTAS